MATVTAKVTTKPGPGVNTVSINIDGRPVPLVNDVGSVKLKSPGRYLTVWHFSGGPGNTLGITVEAGGKEVLAIKKSRIPADENAGAGIDRFEV